LVSVVVVVAASASTMGESSASSSASSLFPSVCSRFSNPSTRFSRASSTSVLGPLFLGTASGGALARASVVVPRADGMGGRGPTVDAGTIKDLAGFARRTGAVALDLEPWSAGWTGGGVTSRHAIPCVCGSSCSSWPREARSRHGAWAGGRCRSVASTLQRPETARPRWTCQRLGVEDKTHVWRETSRQKTQASRQETGNAERQM